MREILDRSQVESRRREIVSAIKEGKIFIYPTDTIYGIGTNAILSNSVKKIREIKNRENKPFSIIAPSKKWITENCFLKAEDLDKYFPGPYTLFVKRKARAVADEINFNDDTLGVRIPNHWFSDFVREAGVPFITSSVNISGQPHMEKFEDLPSSILEEVDYVIYEGEKKGSSSTKIDLTLS